MDWLKRLSAFRSSEETDDLFIGLFVNRYEFGLNV